MPINDQISAFPGNFFAFNNLNTIEAYGFEVGVVHISQITVNMEDGRLTRI
jgi:hypothetical protein